MVRHERDEQNKQAGMPLEQIKYDPAKIKERIKKIKKRRAIINNSLTAVSFVLIGAAIALLILFFVSGNDITIDKKRILENLQALYTKNGKMIAAHSKANLLLLKETAVITFSSLIVPNLLYLGTGMKECIDRMSVNINPEKGIKHLWDCIVFNCVAIGNGFQQIVSTLQRNFSPILHGFQEILTQIGEKIEQIRK